MSSPSPLLIASPTLRRLYKQGVNPREGDLDALAITPLPLAEAEALYELVSREKPAVTLEVGLAYGYSALAICQALAEHQGKRHYAMDPFQETLFHNQGYDHLRQAGFGDLVEFFPEDSLRVLPRLEAAGTRVDLVFLDGSHSFHDTFTEWLYAHRMLRAGGIIAFDDTWMPAVRKVMRYAVTNFGYRDESLPDPVPAWRRQAKRIAYGVAALPRLAKFALTGDFRQESFVLECPWWRANKLGVLRKMGEGPAYLKDSGFTEF